MPTFFARRYMRRPEAVGTTEKVLGAIILLLVAGTVAAFVVQVAVDRDYLFNVEESAYALTTPQRGGAEVETAAGSTVEAGNPFPDPSLEGWRPPKQVDRFTADNLYVKINGRAEAYLRFHVVGLTFGRYAHQSDADRAVDVYWYDMGSADNALEVYKSEQAPDAMPVSIGRNGYEVGGAVFFCKGSSYVQVLPARLDDADARAALKIAERLAERIKDMVDGP